MNTITLLALLLLQSSDGEPVTGPLTDAIERRIEKFSERVEAWQSGSTLALKRMEEMQLGKFAEVLEQIREIRSQRDGLLAQVGAFRDEVQSFRSERVGLLARIQDACDQMREASARWTPIQNLVDRLTELVWKLVIFCVSLCVGVVIIGSIGLFLYVRLKNKIFEIGTGK